jgi:hypothetical protein
MTINLGNVYKGVVGCLADRLGVRGVDVYWGLKEKMGGDRMNVVVE